MDKLVSNWSGSAWSPASELHYLYDGWNIIWELDALHSLAKVRGNVWGLDVSGTLQGAGGVGGLLYSRDIASGIAYIPAYDAMGNIHGMINSVDGSLAAAYEYDAFGNTLRESGAYAASNPFRFATKYADLETGLVQYNTRYYSPSLGRFLNRDTISEQGGLNLYAYCGNNGVNRWDLLGMGVPRWVVDQEAYTYKDADGFDVNVPEKGHYIEVEDVKGNASNDPFDNIRQYGDPQGITGTLHLNLPTGDSLTINLTHLTSYDAQQANQAFYGAVANFADAVNTAAREANAAIAAAAAAQAATGAPNSERIANGPGIDDSKFKAIAGIGDVADPRARALLRFIANDPKANALAASASASTGFANTADRINNRLTEYGTLQALALVGGKVTPVLYPDMFQSGQGDWNAGFNSLAAIDGDRLPGYAQDMKISGQIYWANFHDHGNTGPLSGGDAGWAQSNGGMTVVRNGNTLYIATGVSSPSGPISLLYKGPASLLNFK